MSFLITHPDVKDKHLENVHHILPAAAPVGAALIQQFKERFPGITVREGMLIGFLMTNYLLDFLKVT